MAEKVIDALASRILDLEDRCVDVEACKSTNDFVESMRNNNTVQQTKSHIRLFTNWLATKQEMRAPKDIEPTQLDTYLAQFTLSIRKAGNEDIGHPSRQYEPSSLVAMHNSVFRHLNSVSYGHNIKTSELLQHSRAVLAAKMKELKQLGKGNKPNAAQPFTSDELTKMFAMNLLGTGNPKALISTMWLNATVHFGLRGRQEHTQMLWGDMELKFDNSGVEYVEFNERATKTRQGTTRSARAFAPKMYSTGTEHCPVQVYKEFARRRPADASLPDSRFYLNPLDGSKSDLWFSSHPMGKNTIGDIAKKLASDAGLQSDKKTNHSGRKMAIQTMLHAGIAPTDVMQLSGHKNFQSLNSYAHLSLEQQRSVSNLLTSKLSTEPAAEVETELLLEPAISTCANSSSCHNFYDGLNNLEIIGILSEPFEGETVSSSTSLGQRQFSMKPSTSGSVTNNFLNGTISGNVTININSWPKRRRVDAQSDEE